VFVTRDGHDPFPLPRSPGAIEAAALLADGRVVSSDARRRLRFYAPDQGVLLADLDAPFHVMLLRPSATGTRLVTVASTTISTDAPALWDIERYQLIGRLSGHVGLVRSARFVRGGEILTTGADGTVRAWNGETGQLHQIYRGSARFLADAALDPSGTLLVAGGGDGLLRFWDVATGRLLWKFSAHKSYLIGVHFEGDEIVTRGFGGDVARWGFPGAPQLMEGCKAKVALNEHEACTMIPK